MEQQLLQQVCTKHNVPSRLVSNLLIAEFEIQGATRHSKVFSKIKKHLSKEWREDMDVIMKELTHERREKESVKPGKRKKDE